MTGNFSVVRSGSKAEKLTASKCCPLYPHMFTLICGHETALLTCLFSAVRGLMHRSKLHRYSITWSALNSCDGRIVILDLRFGW
jgi:hypothetical protein